MSSNTRSGSETARDNGCSMGKDTVSAPVLYLWAAVKDLLRARRKWMMKTNLDRDVDVIRAAGGLVWRDSPHGKLLAIVHRRRYGDEWSLPKGKLKKHETWLEAARREVQEETACRVQVDGFAG